MNNTANQVSGAASNPPAAMAAGNVLNEPVATGQPISALIDRARIGNLAGVERLLAEGPADLLKSTLGVEQETALHVAAGNGKSEIVRCLIKKSQERGLQKDVFLDKGDSRGETALHKVARTSWTRGDSKMDFNCLLNINQLIDAGANPILASKEGQTPWDLSQSQSDDGQRRPWSLPSVALFAAKEMDRADSETPDAPWLFEDSEARALQKLSKRRNSWISVSLSSVRLIIC
jgi:ankyrin repeat protein